MPMVVLYWTGRTTLTHGDEVELAPAPGEKLLVNQALHDGAGGLDDGGPGTHVT